MRISDWSSDVCSSDLPPAQHPAHADHPSRLSGPGAGIARHCDLSMENCKMTKLKLGPITEDKPVKVTIDLPGALHRDLVAYADALARENGQRSEEHTSELKSLMRTSYAVFCLKKKTQQLKSITPTRH